METGLLWYDDSSADIAGKAQEAAEQYEKTFARRPNSCYVNPPSLPGEEKRFSLNGIKLLSHPTMLPNHFWVGAEARNR